MKPQGRRRTGAPSLRGLKGRSATELNGQAAKGRGVSSVAGGWMPENISGVPAGRSVFHLTSPFIGLSHSPGDCGRLTKTEHFHLLRKGDISNVVKMGTFLMSVDIKPASRLTSTPSRRTISPSFILEPYRHSPWPVTERIGKVSTSNHLAERRIGIGIGWKAWIRLATCIPH